MHEYFSISKMESEALSRLWITFHYSFHLLWGQKLMLDADSYIRKFTEIPSFTGADIYRSPHSFRSPYL